ncbi:MAG: hypothetical protein JST87_06020 [Bacteroidetes bacterium]|nr:hypothetical protein [Bacteroidota bacterium]MBS1934829.1 hypothetical protein [Bacteroidota bacterium]
MIKFQELKVGDIVIAEYEGKQSEGEVIDIDREDKEVCVETDVQDFWYTPDHLFAIPLDDSQLQKFGFEKKVNEDGSVKYMKDAFRILLSKPEDFSNFEMWYREDRRHIKAPINVHELQNHFSQMTKVGLTR